MLRRILDSPWLYFGLAGLLLVIGLLSMFEIRLPARPEGDVTEIATLKDRGDLNVVFIVIDTLRADHVGSYGYARETTPYMDHLASEGIRFANVEAQSTWTKTSMASMWLSTYPQRTGVLRFSHAVPEDPTLPAEIFRNAGYLTTGIVRNGWLEANFGFARGFDTYIKPQAVRTPKRFQEKSISDEKLVGNDENATDAAREFLRLNRNDKFLLYVHYMDVHQYVYESRSALFGAEYVDAYDNALHWTDRNVGGVLRELDDLEIADRTLVVIVSDHGEAFREHGAEGHAQNLYRETTDTPWLIRLPFRLKQPIVVEPKVANVDIWPTLLDLVGLPQLENSDGHSQVPAILAASRGETLGTDGRAVFAQLDRRWANDRVDPHPLVAVTRPPYRLLFDATRPDKAELYDHSKDPGETENLAEELPEVVAELRTEAETYLAGESEWATPSVEIDELRRSQLRALGYGIEDK